MGRIVQISSAPWEWLRNQWKKSRLAVIAGLFAVLPLLLPLFFACYVLEARLQLGRWPKFGDPDPKMLNLPYQRSLVALAMVQFPVYPMIAVILAVIGRIRRRDFPMWTIVAISVGTAGLVLGLSLWDPGGFLNWFAD